jgi:hypothetical protein
MFNNPATKHEFYSDGEEVDDEPTTTETKNKIGESDASDEEEKSVHENLIVDEDEDVESIDEDSREVSVPKKT